jgi:hypothetical protein
MNELHTAATFSLWALEFMTLPPLAVMLVVATAGVVWAARMRRPLGLYSGSRIIGLR